MVPYPAGSFGKPQSTWHWRRLWHIPPFRFTCISARTLLCPRFPALGMFRFSPTIKYFFQVSRQAVTLSRIQECLLDFRISSPGVSKLKSGPVLAFVNKVYRHIDVRIHLRSACGCSARTEAESSHPDGRAGPQNLEYLFSGPLQRTFANPRNSTVCLLDHSPVFS